MINIIGSILGTSGYDVHTRQLANALAKLTDVRLTVGAIPPGAEKNLSDREIQMLKKQADVDEINLIITNPQSWQLHANGKRNWAFLVWEGDTIPESILEECLKDNIERIFVPSNHTKKALSKGYYKGEDPPFKYENEKDKNFWSRVHVMPHGVDLNIFYEQEKPTDIFRFICNKGFRNMEDRGGIQYAIQAFSEEFKEEEKVELVVKINPAYGTENIQALVNEIVKDKQHIGTIRIDATNYKYEELIKLYNYGHVFVSPTRAEAFNMPCLEAMACGLPVITTNFGGQTDFVDDNSGWLISGELTPVQHEIQYEECQWLTPNISELRKAMREAYNAEEIRKEKATNAKEVVHQWTWDHTAKQIVELL